MAPKAVNAGNSIRVNERIRLLPRSHDRKRPAKRNEWRAIQLTARGRCQRVPWVRLRVTPTIKVRLPSEKDCYSRNQ